MGNGCSHDEASQSQPSEQASANQAKEKVTEAKPNPARSKLMAVEKKAADDQAKLSANNSESAAVKEENPCPPGGSKPLAVEKTAPDQAMVSTKYENREASVVKETKPTASNNCFMVNAKDLAITWSENNSYWQWSSQETSGVSGDVAELLNVCWLEVHGNFETAKLSPGTLYEVVFVVKLKARNYGWELPVNCRLTLPDGSLQWRKVNLKEIPTEQWAEIPIGKFRASQEKQGCIECSLYEYEGGMWKKGLVIKGVAIRPTKN